MCVFVFFVVYVCVRLFIKLVALKQRMHVLLMHVMFSLRTITGTIVFFFAGLKLSGSLIPG